MPKEFSAFSSGRSPTWKFNLSNFSLFIFFIPYGSFASFSSLWNYLWGTFVCVCKFVKLCRFGKLCMSFILNFWSLQTKLEYSELTFVMAFDKQDDCESYFWWNWIIGSFPCPCYFFLQNLPFSAFQPATIFCITTVGACLCPLLSSLLLAETMLR